MSDRNNTALLLVMLLIALLLGCIEEGGQGAASCNQLWMECSGTANDYMICVQASDLQQSVSGGTRFFSYYNCLSGQRTPTLTAPQGCVPSFRY